MEAIGIDIGGTSFKIGLVDGKGKLLDSFSYPVDHLKNQEDQINELGEKINDFLQKKEIGKSEIIGIGIGCPGSIDSSTGFCDYSNNLKWSHLNVCGILARITSIKCRISNDANVACLGEVKFGVARKYKNVVMLTLGTGIGSGIVIDGKLYEGNQGKGAECGHEVIKMNGRKCTCGRRGCFEAYASATALIKDTKAKMRKHKDSLMWDYVKQDIESVGGKTAFECAKKGDKAAIEVRDRYCFYLAEGILNICSIFRPECIILGGGVSNQKEYLLNNLVPLLEKANYGFGLGPKVEILIAELGNQAGMIGAASLLF
ncbi:MAG: ROK family protein [Bacilli bacterium]|jgi:glucokinase|nr:ROK family protein [Bacilli bacterium]